MHKKTHMNLLAIQGTLLFENKEWEHAMYINLEFFSSAKNNKQTKTGNCSLNN